MNPLDHTPTRNLHAVKSPDVAALEACPADIGQVPEGATPSHRDGDGLDTYGDAREKATAPEIDELRFLDPPEAAGDLGRLGNYRVLRLIGKGGMGFVFLAEDPRLQRQVALKVMRPHLAEKLVSRQRFLREARATATIHSDHVITIHEIGQVHEIPYLAAEFLQGRPLDHWIEQQKPSPPAAQVIDFALQIARGLDAAHKANVIHRDIKPSNIWVEPTGRIKILDFGLARTVDPDFGLTQSGTVLGTPAYMAPEQADGSDVDCRSDLFSLGCVFYELSTGIQPFQGPSMVAVLKAVAMVDPKPVHEQHAELPLSYSNLVQRLMAKNPDNRPRSTEEVVKALETISEGSAASGQWSAVRERGSEAPTAIPNLPSSERRPPASGVFGISWRTTRRHWRLILEAVLAVTLIVAVGQDMKKQETHRDQAAAVHPANQAARPKPALATQGVSDNEILLGTSAPFSGPAREVGRAMEVGMRTYFNHVNEGGGIAGRKIKLVALDDGHQPELALANIKELYERRKVFAVIGNAGTHTAEKTMPYARARKMIFFGAFTGAALLRKEPPDRYVFNYRASHVEETAAIVRYLKEVKGIQAEQIAVFAQQDSYGESGHQGVVKMLRKYGRSPESILRVGHPQGSSEVGPAVQEILRHKEIRAVVMVSSYRAAAQFIRLLKEAKAELLFANVSGVGADALSEELRQIRPEYAAGVIVTQVVPHPASESTVVLKYNELLQKHYPNEKPNFASLEGYLSAAVFCEGLRRNTNPTTETLVDSLETIRDFDLGLGAPLNFGPSKHQASFRVWGTVLDSSGHYQTLDLE